MSLQAGWATVSNPRELINADVIARASRLEIVARETVEGFISGLHKSPFHGLSVEFRQHRNYSYGDDLKHLDWKVYGKTDRYYIKEYEKETNVRVYIAVDGSASMGYGEEGETKYDYASQAAACLAYLLLRQQDAPSLYLIGSEGIEIVPPKTSGLQMQTISHTLATHHPKGKADIPEALGRIASEAHPKSIIIIISDLFAHTEKLLPGLRQIRQRKHDTIVLHVLHKDEMEFPFHRMTRFKDLELPRSLLVNTHFLRNAYIREVNSFIELVKSECLSTRTDYSLQVTSEPLAVALTAYLAARKGGNRR